MFYFRFIASVATVQIVQLGCELGSGEQLCLAQRTRGKRVMRSPNRRGTSESRVTASDSSVTALAACGGFSEPFHRVLAKVFLRKKQIPDLKVKVILGL